MREDDVVLMGMPNFHLGGSWLILTALYKRRNGLDHSGFRSPGAARSLATRPPNGPAAGPDRDPAHSFESGIFAWRFLISAQGDLFRVANRRRSIGPRVEAFRCEFLQYYGTSETWIISALKHQHIFPEISIDWRLRDPHPLVSMKIADGNGAELPTGRSAKFRVACPRSSPATTISLRRRRGRSRMVGIARAISGGVMRLATTRSSIGPRT